MPIFEVDHGQPVLARHLTPAAGAFGAESAALIADHLGALLGEQLMPVASRQPGVDSPHLLAVDASGQPVVVEVVHRLDGEALLRALKYGGQAARLSSRDFASLYHRGEENFEADLAAFSSDVPAVSRHAAVRHPGSRLLLVCADVEPGVLDAIEFLRQPDWHVDVLQIGVLSGSDGRRFVDVSPLSKARVEPGHARRDWIPPTRHAATAPSAATANPPTPHAFEPSTTTAPTPAVTVPAVTVPALLPSLPVSEPEPLWRRTAFPERVQAPVTGSLPDSNAGSWVPSPTAEPWSPPPVALPLTPPTAPPPVAPPPTAPPLTPGPGIVMSPILEQSLASLSPAARARLFPLQGPPIGTVARQPVEIPVEVAVTPQSPPALLEVPSASPMASSSVDVASASPLRELERVAALVPTPATLVWVRERRNQRFEAKLRLDGVIVIAGGSEHVDPTEAAAVASGSLAHLDGWRLWHVGEDGPTLADLRDR